MRPTGLRAVVVLASASLFASGLTSSSATALGAPRPAAAPAPLAGTPLVADSVNRRKADLDKEIADLRDTLEGTADDLVDAAVALRKSEAELVDVRARLDAARQALAAAERRDAQLAADLAYAQAEEGKAVKALDAQAQAEEQTRSRLGALARDAYAGTGMTGLSIALQAESPEAFADRMAVAGAALRSENAEVDRLVVVQAEMRAKTAKLTALRARTAELKTLAAQAVDARQAAADEAAAAEAEQTALVAQQATALATIKSKQAAEKARLAKAQAEQDKLEKILRDRAERARRERERQNRNRGGGSSSGSSGGGGSSSGGGAVNRGGFLSYPANGPITSGFGMRYHPILHYWRLHAGTDFGVPCGTPLHAAADGVVVRAGWAGGFGNQIVIDHGYVRGIDLASSYNHMSRIYVHGGHVKRGQVIGLSGTTGLSTGCHLHFEVYENGVHVNPMRWL